MGHLIEKYGPDIPSPDLRHEPARYPDRSNMSSSAKSSVLIVWRASPKSSRRRAPADR